MSEPPRPPVTPGAARPTWYQRLHDALGPVAAGLLLDFADLITFGPLGYTVGPVLGVLLGAYLATFYGFRGWSRAGLALLAAVYLALPVTGLLPIATLVSALARYRGEPARDDV